jgi:hypothetical protein
MQRLEQRSDGVKTNIVADQNSTRAARSITASDRIAIALLTATPVLLAAALYIYFYSRGHSF